MQFKWRKFYSKLCSKAALAGPLAFIFGLTLTLSLEKVSATVFVKPNPAQGGAIAASSSGNAIFYYYVGATGTNIFEFTPIDVQPSSSTTWGSNALYSNVVEFFVSSDKVFTVSGGQQAVITAFANPDPGATPRPIPIAAVNGVLCDDSGNCRAKNQLNPTQNRYYAAYYPTPRATVRVGFFPQDICKDANDATGVTVQGCASGALTGPSAGNPAKLQLKFQILTAPNSGVAAVPTGASIDAMTSHISLSMQNDTGTFNCPTSSLSATYLPGDGAIQFIPIDQNNNSTPIFSLSQYSGQAGAESIYVVGNDQADPVVTSSFRTANSIVKEASLTAITFLDGFTRSADGDLHAYRLSYLIKDQTGVIIPPQGSCILQPVYAASIEGFLGKSSCFIATAAFGSTEAAPVLLFRQLRDEVLIGSRLGDLFVNWYYSWSENAADWLLERPVLRIPLLYLMIPLELLAWILLYPLGALAWLGLSSLALLFGVRFLQRRSLARRTS